MTNDAILVLRTLFGTIWSLFNSWYIPGTNVTPAVAGFFLLAASVGIRFVTSFLNSPGVGVSGVTRFVGANTRYQSRNNRE